MSDSVAVLLAAYNGERWLTEQVESILNQIDVNLHLFISVDLSDDSTYAWCKKQEQVYSNITVLDYGERFGGAARNFFRLIRDVDFSAYDYISFADQDDIWLEKKLSYATTTIKTNKIDAFSSDVIAFWPDGRERLVKKSYPQKRLDHYFEAAGPGCSYVLTKKSIQKFKGFMTEHWDDVNQITLHDWMIYCFYRTNNLRWHIDTLPLLRYRQHESNQVGSNSGLKAICVRLMMVRKKWYSGQVKRIANLMNHSSSFSLNRWYLITHFNQLRRRPRDAYALLVMLASGLF